MRVTTPQYEISAKNHIFSVKTKPSRAQSTHHWEKKVIGKSSILAQGKSCVLPTDPFCHAKLITFQCIQVTDNDFADRWSAGSHPFLPLSSWFFHPFPKQRACWQAIFIIAGKWEVCDWPRWWGTTQRNTCTPCVVWWRWLLFFPLHKLGYESFYSEKQASLLLSLYISHHRHLHCAKTVYLDIASSGTCHVNPDQYCHCLTLISIVNA